MDNTTTFAMCPPQATIATTTTAPSNSSTPTRAVSGVVVSAQEIAARAEECFPGVEHAPSRDAVTWRTLFSSCTTPTDSLCAGVAVLPPGAGHLCAHRHAQAEFYYVTEGRGTVVIDGREAAVEAGSAVFIPGDAEHAIRNVGDVDLKFCYVFPTGAFGDVVYRFS